MMIHFKLKKSLCLYAAIVLFGLISMSWAAAPKVLENKQSPTAVNHQKPLPEIDPADIELRIKEVKKRLAEAEAAENEQTARQLGILFSQLQERTARLRELDSVYQRLLTALNKKKILEKEEALLKEKVQTQQQITLPENPPYSLSFYDTILDKLITDDHKKETAILGISLAEKALEDARSRLDDSGQDLRKSKEELALMEPGKVTGKLKWEIEQARLKLEISQGVFDLQRTTRQNLSIEVRLAKQNSDVTQQNLVWVSKNLHFDNADLEKQIEAINRNRDELQATKGSAPWTDEGGDRLASGPGKTRECQKKDRYCIGQGQIRGRRRRAGSLPAASRTDRGYVEPVKSTGTGVEKSLRACQRRGESRKNRRLEKRD